MLNVLKMGQSASLEPYLGEASRMVEPRLLIAEFFCSLASRCRPRQGKVKQNRSAVSALRPSGLFLHPNYGS